MSVDAITCGKVLRVNYPNYYEEYRCQLPKGHKHSHANQYSAKDGRGKITRLW